MITPLCKASSFSRVSLFLMAMLFIGLSLSSVSANASIYYVDGGNQQTGTDGSKANPWQTLLEAWMIAPSGSTVVVSGGTYDAFSISNPRSELDDFITFEAAEGETPTISGVSVIFPELQNGFIRFDGFRIRGAAGTRVVSLENVRSVEILNNEILGEKWAKSGQGTTGLQISGSDSVSIAGNHVHEIHTGLMVGGSTGTIIHRNLIMPKAGSGIKYSGRNQAGVIEANHVKGAPYTSYPEDPDAVQNPHASIISVRSGDLLIKGNLLHDMGSSSGVMFYSPDADGGESAYSNITIENNAIFSTNNYYALRIYNLGENFKVINNLLFARPREGSCDGFTKDARYRYNTALVVHSKADGFDGSGLHLFNNILVGALMAPETVRESNNVIWSWFNGSDWLSQAPNSSSMLLTSSYAGCGNHSRAFENGTFFEASLDFSSLSDDPVPNFSLGANSSGINFGDPDKQAAKSLGTVGSDGLLLDDGVVRSSSIHSVGPYEILVEEAASTSPPSAPKLMLE